MDKHRMRAFPKTRIRLKIWGFSSLPYHLHKVEFVGIHVRPWLNQRKLGPGFLISAVVPLIGTKGRRALIKGFGVVMD